MKIEFAEIAYEEFLNTIEYYDITKSKRIVIIAVAHSHRKPYYWIDRFKE